ncbi:enoyl-CoA hydratase [Nereida ignava]|uniref:Enoyl-CoA hydratase domain-containing protein 3, mitochondrial n=1 Tax=Nereida ignava TaxID=282199 RepID=A0A0U1NHT1_9RHOB|nr:enoyl-CoA hydratase [Nereida ignava]CRK74292.1 putative enoyl-CoA hydratase echA8 [Nereida ignava]SFJ45216.1 Enoyl-CoA hydratase/carnithine racemase [Nereida ignava DSM 16309]
MTDTQTSLYTRCDANGVAYIELATPQTLNALSSQMIEALTALFVDIAADQSIRCVVLSGAGKAFCAGHNLKEMQAMREGPDAGARELTALFDACAQMMTAIRTLPQPVIAQVHGVAAAAGCQLVAACDMAVAAEGTRFAVNGVNIGLFCSTPMVALSRNLPRKQAFEMLVTGDFIDTNRALDLGLINRIAEPSKLAPVTRDLAETVAAKLGAAVRLGKGAFYDQLEMPVADAYTFTRDVMVQNMANEDTAEGITAFNEKRKPNWDIANS